MLSINDILISDSFIWLYSYSSIVGRRMFCGETFTFKKPEMRKKWQYSGKTHVLWGNIPLQKIGNAEKPAETVCVFPLTKGFIALYGYSVIFKSLSPLGDSKLCFRLTKTEWFNSIFRCQTIIQFMLLSRTES